MHTDTQKHTNANTIKRTCKTDDTFWQNIECRTYICKKEEDDERNPFYILETPEHKISKKQKQKNKSQTTHNPNDWCSSIFNF